MFIEEMSFQVTADDMEGRIITQFGGACFDVAGAELVFSVPLEILRIEATYTTHDNEGASARETVCT